MREGRIGGRERYRRGYFVKRCRHGGGSGFFRAEQRGYSGRGRYFYALCDIDWVNTSGGTVSPGASVGQSPSVSEEDETDDSPSPELGGRAARKLRWLGENPVVRQEWTRGEQRQIDMDSAAFIAEESLATEELREWLSLTVTYDCLTGTDGLYNPLLLGAVDDTEDLTASAKCDGFCTRCVVGPAA